VRPADLRSPPTEIKALTPAHDPGSATLKVATGGAACEQTMYFDFVAAPIVRLVKPPPGPVTGGTRSRSPAITSAASRRTIQSARRPLSVSVSWGRTGSTASSRRGDGVRTVAVTAYDEIGGTRAGADERDLHLRPGRR
jgi:hypothetical protein